MKILWICPTFLHPTDRGGKIRTLGTLKELHKRHEIHFAALNLPRNPEGPERSSEYSSRHIAVAHLTPNRRSIKILPQLVASLVYAMPMGVFRYSSSGLRQKIDALIAAEHYDSIVCDFLSSAPNIRNLSQCVLFQHNVETTIWQRHAEQCTSLAKKLFFRIQARKMRAYEQMICRAVKHVIAVSDIDASRFKRMFGIESVTSVPTGVDVQYFAPRGAPAPMSDIVFSGSMDWLPNVDAVVYFLAEVLPLIRARFPGVTFTIAGRSPDAAVLKAAQDQTGVCVTGTVEDIRPYLWGSKLSVVPIRVGGGTRLKIYECMAAGIPVVSTTVGAEGLQYKDGEDIVIADDPGSIASACVRLLSDGAARRTIANNALQRAQRDFSWEAIGREFETILKNNRIRYN